MRKARTYFDEARQISWSIYNIALVNCAMAAIQWVSHISQNSGNTCRLSSTMILPNCGPDTKYLLAFIRTQLSTTTTMILVFGPKVISPDLVVVKVVVAVVDAVSGPRLLLTLDLCIPTCLSTEYSTPY